MNWDDIAADIGLPATWRAEGYDSPEYMADPDSVYRETRFLADGYVPTGFMRCVWPKCSFRSKDVEAMFRHVHDRFEHHHREAEQ